MFYILITTYFNFKFCETQCSKYFTVGEVVNMNILPQLKTLGENFSVLHTAKFPKNVDDRDMPRAKMGFHVFHVRLSA